MIGVKINLPMQHKKISWKIRLDDWIVESTQMQSTGITDDQTVSPFHQPKKTTKKNKNIEVE